MEAVLNKPVVTFSVDLKHALIWVARALDYVGVDDVNHNHRVAYIAYECARSLGWEPKKQEFVFLAGLIHDCGVSQTAEHSLLVEVMQPEDEASHCHRGYLALKQCELLSQFANTVLYHHTPWQELESIHLSPFEKDVAALVYLADRLDALRAQVIRDTHPDLIVLQQHIIAERLQASSGSLFKPEFVSAMCHLVTKEGFWFAMETESIEAMPLKFSHLDWLEKELSINTMMSLGKFIAGIVDAKSTFTYHHSLKVAELAAYLARKLNCSGEVIELLYIAGLVHDIGKLRTPDHILHKPGKLTAEEYVHIKRHSIDTRLALSMVFPDSVIGEWASNHHERLNGTGYPYKKTAQELDLPSRILAVADIFQALSQERPYRDSLSSDKIAQLMQQMVEQGELDGRIFDCLLIHLQECYELSVN